MGKIKELLDSVAKIAYKWHALKKYVNAERQFRISPSLKEKLRVKEIA